MQINLPYGKSHLPVHIPDRQLIDVLVPNTPGDSLDEEGEIMAALNDPIGSKKLSDIAGPGSKVAVIVSDITRPLPLPVILPFVLGQLTAAGCRYEDIRIIFALGNHRLHTLREQETLVGPEIMQKIKCEDFDSKDTVYLGVTSYGTPVHVSTKVYEADLKICVGNIEPHYFAGFTGGLKALLPGVCSKDTIACNHSLMKKPGASMGRIEGNPVRMDLEEAGLMAGVDFIFNVILSENKRILKAVAGHPIHAHREGCRYAAEYYSIEFGEKADIVVASAGGYPKDMNLYQAQKALENARKVLNTGGAVILTAECTDGPGEGTFKKWMETAKSPAELVFRFDGDFELGGHKAGMIGRVLREHPVYLISGLNQEETEKYFFHYASSVDEAIKKITTRLNRQPRIIVMPYAHLTMPLFKAPEPVV